ncbi:hypothetical protein [Accumulibacter sp.]|uniref:hypothetical protein n=1 Tax=Accumulibacter sp. TaxID=2053492 RepID=UPI00263141A0|nr:hypothetical protein [Accumulibacter sp.]
MALDRDLRSIRAVHDSPGSEGDNSGDTTHDRLAAGVDALAVEGHPARLGKFLACRDSDRDLLADGRRRVELAILPGVHRARAGQRLAEQSRDLCAQPHAVCAELCAAELFHQFESEAGRIAVA